MTFVKGAYKNYYYYFAAKKTQPRLLHMWWLFYIGATAE